MASDRVPGEGGPPLAAKKDFLLQGEPAVGIRARLQGHHKIALNSHIQTRVGRSY
jgi:hypothetical protein